MAKFIMLIGIPAAGKDTWANKYVKENPNTVIHSSDNIREELYGNQSIQGDPNKIFELMRSRAINDLCAGKDIIYNATNVSYRDRKSIIAEVKKLNLKIELIAKVFATPIEECKRRNNLRDRQVPDYVYDKMLKKWKTPCEWEGFDKIEVVKEETENIKTALANKDEDTLAYYKDKLVTETKSIVSNYPVRTEVATLIKNNPNILAEIKQKYDIAELEARRATLMEADYYKYQVDMDGNLILDANGKPIRAYDENGNPAYNEDYIKSVDDRLKTEIETQKSERQEYLLALIQKQRAATTTTTEK